MTRTSGDLTDIDSLCLSVRDRESKKLIDEAVAAYRGGAYRSAVIATWIAVAADIITKARELANQGEAAPAAYIRKIDSAIENNNIPSLQKAENELTTVATDDLALITPQEKSLLCRLQDDRHLCAHPAFVDESTLFSPSPELVRMHIVHALEILLVQAPLQGKAAIERFRLDLVSASFPSRESDIEDFVRNKYLESAKDVLIINLIKCLVKSLFEVGSNDYTEKENSICISLNCIGKTKTSIYEREIPLILKNYMESVDDSTLLKIGKLIGLDARFWTWLSTATQARIKKLTTDVDPENLHDCPIFNAVSIPELQPILIGKLKVASNEVVIRTLSEYPNVEYIEFSIDFYLKSGGWRTAEARGRAVLIPHAPLFSIDDLKRTLDGVVGNYQIWSADNTAEIIENVFDLTRPLLFQSKGIWLSFLDSITSQHCDNNPDKKYAMPAIRKKLDELGYGGA